MHKWLEALLLSCLAVFAPIKPLMVVTGVLIFADLFFGIYAAVRRGEKVTSAALRRTLTKCMVYEAALCFGYLAEHYMLSDSVPITKIVSGLIGLVEFKSIAENLNDISQQNLLKALIDKLGSDNNKK